MLPYKQLSLTDIFTDCQNILDSDKPAFLSLLESNINLNDFIPHSFYDHYYAYTGRPRKYHLHSMIWALIIQRILSIPTDTLLIVFLKYSKDLRDFCGFRKVPDASKFTRFKQDFLPDLQLMFDKLVDVTEPICQDINQELASMTIFDTSGIEAFVTENNPKFANRIIKQLKTYAKAMNFDKSYDPYKAAYGSMPPHAAANPNIKQLYINGHFCYVFKFGIITNGLGIVRNISFYNKQFTDSHPEIKVDKKSDSPGEDKSIHDARLIIPTLTDFFNKHPLINPKYFLGDSAFDSVGIYKSLFEDLHFEKAYIPLNQRSKLENTDYIINEDGIPCCPHNPSLLMRYEGTSKLRSGVTRYKFVCPKIRWQNRRRVCQCDNPCTDSISGRMIHLYPEKDLRAYPGTLRGTEEWDNTYKIRANIEKTIYQFKDSYCIADRRTQNEKTLHADLLLSGITQLLTVVTADKVHKHEYIRSLKSLIA